MKTYISFAALILTLSGAIPVWAVQMASQNWVSNRVESLRTEVNGQIQQLSIDIQGRTVTNYVDTVISNFVEHTDYYHTNYVREVVSNQYHNIYTTITETITNQPIAITVDAGATRLLVNTNNLYGIAGDLNIYAVSNVVNFGAKGGLADNITWEHLIDSDGNTFTFRSAQKINSSPAYYISRYSRDGGPTTYSGSGANMVYPEGILIQKLAVYNTYRIITIDANGTQTASSSSFSPSLLNNGGDIIVDNRAFRAVLSYTTGEIVNRLLTTNDLSSIQSEISDGSKIHIDKLYDKYQENYIAHYQLKQEYYGSEVAPSPPIFEFDIVWTNYTTAVSNGKTIRTYPSSNMTYISGPTAHGYATYYWNETDQLGWWNLYTGYSSVSSNTSKLPYLSPENMFHTNINWNISANDVYNENYEKITLLNKITDSFKQYICGDLGVYDKDGNKLGTLMLAETNGTVSVTNEYVVSANGKILLDEWAAIEAITNAANNSTQTLGEFVTNSTGGVTKMVTPSYVISSTNKLVTLENAAFNYVTQGSSSVIKISIPNSLGGIKPRMFYLVLECTSADVEIALNISNTVTVYLPKNAIDLMKPEIGINIYTFDEISPNKFWMRKTILEELAN